MKLIEGFLGLSTVVIHGRSFNIIEITRYKVLMIAKAESTIQAWVISAIKPFSPNRVKLNRINQKE